MEIRGHFPKVTQNLHPSGGQHLSCSVLQGSAGGWVGGRPGPGVQVLKGRLTLQVMGVLGGLGGIVP